MVPHPTQNITYCRVSLLYPHSARYLTHFGLFFRGSNFLVFLFPRLYVDKAHICPLIIIYCTIIEIITNIRLDGDVSLLFQMVFFFLHFFCIFQFFNFSNFIVPFNSSHPPKSPENPLFSFALALIFFFKSTKSITTNPALK